MLFPDGKNLVKFSAVQAKTVAMNCESSIMSMCPALLRLQARAERGARNGDHGLTLTESMGVSGWLAA